MSVSEHWLRLSIFRKIDFLLRYRNHCIRAVRGIGFFMAGLRSAEEPLLSRSEFLGVMGVSQSHGPLFEVSANKHSNCVVDVVRGHDVGTPLLMCS